MNYKVLLRIGGLVTYVESNVYIEDLLSIIGFTKQIERNDCLLHSVFSSMVKCTFVYNHGFPDYSVEFSDDICITEKVHFFLKDSSTLIDIEYLEASKDISTLLASRCATKMSECIFRSINYSGTTSSILEPSVFIAFNTNGIFGNTNGTFCEKTLAKDMLDIDLIVSFFMFIFNRSQLFLIGISTGAFLTIAYASGCPEISHSNILDHSKSIKLEGIYPHPKLCGIILMACVDDIPSSYSIDFNEQQICDFRLHGHCSLLTSIPIVNDEIFNIKVANNGEKRSIKLLRKYLDSYSLFPRYEQLGKKVQVPTLLIHGTDDKYVPYNMALNLIQLNEDVSNGKMTYDYFYHSFLLSRTPEEMRSYLNINEYIDRIKKHLQEIKEKSNLLKLYTINGANHLLTNTKHMMMAQKVSRLFIDEILYSKNILNLLDYQQ
ncbi:uncharacterized protein CMU_041460 [Cryptosporidium muris RN66]|uniref:Serine aminopeptidase S33 domain-containing protein n=1 Tax=Cryptosporidium muris (strain RN66) TaxID=441375 RepID=B6AA34_CRYMR|nr:uncharacterized protein CMU_041460 [Cryptosporidium muris RN66]EEA05075.1 hypothetical protein, conserved [Cryptosporidium muris RN66]|eukprot:XP_002139424.1 hypothetical protein [Cryptosporidium muris RN66]